MAVIINDFEVIISQPEGPAGATAEQQQGPPALAPIDIRDVVRQQMERLARIRAH